MMTTQQERQYKRTLRAMTDDELEDEVAKVVEIAAHFPVYCTHDQMAGCCYDECERSNRLKVYSVGFARASGEVRIHNEVVRQKARIEEVRRS